MIQKYIVVSVRTLMRNKIFTTINLLGLALGMASSFLVFVYVYYHSAFDNRYKDANIHRVLTDTYSTDGQFVKQYAFSMHFLGPELKQNFSSVEESVRMFEFETLLVYMNEDIFFNKVVVGADSNVVKFFNLAMVSGDPETALIEPRTAVITQTMAKLLFRDEDPIGKTIGLGYGFHDPWQYKVTGVIQDLPVNTHLRFDVLTSAIGVNSDLGNFTMFDGGEANYHYPMFDTYVKLRENTETAELEVQMNNYLHANIARIMDKYGLRKLHLQHISDIHLRANIHPGYLGGMERRSLVRSGEIDLRTIQWITYGGIVLLLFSIFNYINLTYINSINRFKEIGLRKLFGASLFRLFTQFFVESFTLTLLAAVIAVGIILITVNPFYEFLDIPASFKLIDDYRVYLFFVGFVLAVVLVKSVLLFLILLSINMITIQRGKLSESKNGILIRQVLMITQLVASFILISGTLLLARQIDFFLEKDLGFDKDNIVVIRKYTMASGIESVDLTYLQPFKDELKKSPLVESVCLSTITPGFFYNTGQQVWMDEDKRFQANTIYLDKDYMEVYKLKLLAGRFFTDVPANEMGNVVINRKLMTLMGFAEPKDAVGQTIYMDNIGSHYVAPGPQRIIGIMEDFCQEPLSNGIAPIKFHLFNANRGFYSIRLRDGASQQEAVAHIKTVFNKFYPRDYLNYYFLDDFLKQQYKSDETVKRIMQIYTYTSILVAYLGLVAFSVYLIRVKKKSIAIRKILGSTPTGITMLLLREYFVILSVSIILALPLAISAVSEIFESYTYRIPIGWLEFSITSVILIVVVLGTIASQAAKATLENPIKSIRYE
jgi:putative ABC transport system permease protein